MATDVTPFVSYDGTGAGLSDRECFILTKAASEMPGGWHVQYDEDDHGHGSMALIPGNRHDPGATVFLIWREGGRLHLGLGQADFYAGLGTHADVDALVRTVRDTQVGTAAVQRWVSCQPGSNAWRSGSALSLLDQARRPN